MYLLLGSIGITLIIAAHLLHKRNRILSQEREALEATLRRYAAKLGHTLPENYLSDPYLMKVSNRAKIYDQKYDRRDWNREYAR